MVPLSVAGFFNMVYFIWIIVRSGSFNLHDDFIPELSVAGRVCVNGPVPLRDKPLDGEVNPGGVRRMDRERLGKERLGREEGVVGASNCVLVLLPYVVDVWLIRHFSPGVLRKRNRLIPESARVLYDLKERQ